MAEKYELDINLNGGGDENKDSSNDRHRTPGKGVNAVARPRHSTKTNGLDFWASIKSQLGDKAYNSAYNKVKEQASAKGADPNEASKNADKAGDKAKIKAMYLLNQAQQAVTTVATTVGNVATMHIGNTADANMINNLVNTGNNIVSAGTSVAQGAIAAGPWGAIAAVALEALKLGMKAWEVSEQNKKDNIGRAAESERKANRLGYIETGYSR